MKVCVEDYKKRYIKEGMERADILVNRELPVTEKNAYLEFFKSGNRLVYEKPYFAKREFLTVLGTLISIEKDVVKYGYAIKAEYVVKLLDVLEDILNEKTWVLPAHGTVGHIEGKTNSLDLFALETQGSVFEILYLIRNNNYICSIYDKRYKEIKNTAKTVFFEKIYKVYTKNEPGWWETAKMNWGAVCGANIYISCHYAKKFGFISDDEFEKLLPRMENTMKCYINGFGNDGACLEGSDYYKYGMEYFLAFLELYKENKGREKFEFENVALYLQKTYLQNKMSINFSDCSICSKMKYGMMAYMSSLYDKVALPSDFFYKDESKYILKYDKEMCEVYGGDECHRFLPAYRNYYFTDRYKEYLRCLEKEKDDYFCDAQIYVKRDKNVSFYIKGGNNDEPHNHNDIAGFGLIVNGEEIFCELGAGEYTKDYFGSQRYKDLHTSSLGHNVPKIDGMEQICGKEASAEEFRVGKNSVYISFARAYGIKEKKVTRYVKFEDKKILIKDEIEAGEVTERFILKKEPVITQEGFIINTKKTKVMVKCSTGHVTYEAVYVNNHFGEKEKVYITKVKYFGKKAIKSIEIYVNIL